MRDIFVTAAILLTLPFILRAPYAGVLAWSWLAYMNPHRLTWGFAYNLPFAMIIAVTTIVALQFSKEPKQIPWTRETVILAVFTLWMLISTIFALYPALAWEKWDQVWKIQFMVLLTLILITSRERMDLLVWVIALSFGFYGVKGGIFTITTGGAHLVLGPFNTSIANRGDIGTALNMTIPLMRYLQLSTPKKWVRMGLAAAMVLTCFAVIGTHSRGAFLGLVAVLFFLVLKSRKKIVLSALLAATIYAVLHFMPASWSERMHTIETYDQDASAMGRIDAWKYAIALAEQRPLVGGGFKAVDVGERAAHSIFFQALGEQGYVGLGLFLLLGFLTWHSASWVRKRVRKDQELRWAGDLAAMIQVSLVGYTVGGAFLSLTYFDLTYQLVAMVVLCKVMVLRHEAQRATSAAAETEAGLPRASSSAVST